MAFKFSLQSVLRIREIHERAQLQKLLLVSAQTAVVRAEIEELAASMDQFRRTLGNDAVTGIFGAELQFQARREETALARGRELARKLSELHKAEAAQRTRYREARQLREAIATLREKQQAAYILEQSRREQQSQDELFLLRRQRDQAS